MANIEVGVRRVRRPMKGAYTQAISVLGLVSYLLFGAELDWMFILLDRYGVST